MFGGIKNFFSKGNTADPLVKPHSESVSTRKSSTGLENTVGQIRTDSRLNETSHPAFRVRDLPYDENDSFTMEPSKEKIRSPSASTRFTTDIDGKIDQNLGKNVVINFEPYSLLKLKNWY